MKIIAKIFLLSCFIYTAGCTESKETETSSSENNKGIPSIGLPKEKASDPVLKEATSSDPSAEIKTETSESKVILNPPHGEPGHDCAVQVGAPLNSKTQASPSGSQQQLSPATPRLKAPSLQSTSTIPSGKDLNPPHGQPGHDCAIPVGEPLK